MKAKLPLILILNRALLFLTSGFAVFFLPLRERPGIEKGAHNIIPFLDGWTKWDGGWYVSIATTGYHYSSGEQSNVAFFPLYPLTIRFFTLIFKNPYLSGIIISNLAFMLGIFFFFKLLKEFILKDEDQSFLSILFLIFFPYSFFFSAVYSESLFFICAVLCFYYAERKNWFYSGIFGMLACADRFVGIALFPAIVVKYLESLREAGFLTCHCEERSDEAIPPTSLTKGGAESGGILRAILKVKNLSNFPGFIGLIPAGLIGYMIFLYIKFGDPFAFAHTIGQGWEGMKLMKPNPLLPFLSFAKTIFNFGTLPDNKYHVIFQFPIFLFFLFLTFYSFKYAGLSYGIFSLGMLAIPASVSIDLISMGRYLLVIFPCFAVMPLVIKNRYIRCALIALSFIFLTLFTGMFSTWWWVG